jgi:hypothetical protein
MTSTVQTQLHTDVDVDFTYLKKKRKHGQGSHFSPPMTLGVVKQRNSARAAILMTHGHENMAKADAMIPFIKKPTPGTDEKLTVNTDGGHSKGSAFNHYKERLSCEHKTVNHSKTQVCPKTGSID